LGLGRMEDAIHCIAKSIEDRSAEMETLLNDPVFEKVRVDPRIAQILRKLGVADPERTVEGLPKPTIRI
jgi:hypothetical protein